MPLFEKYFSVSEANALVPELRRLVTEIQAEIERLEVNADGVPRAMETIPTNGGGRKLEDLFHSSNVIVERMGRINELGVQVKDARRGLLDFPALRRGEEVLLCWLVEEPEVAYWHDLVQGFMGRQPIESL